MHTFQSSYFKSSKENPDVTQVISINFAAAAKPGRIKCHAKNELGSSEAFGDVIVGDLDDFFVLSGIHENHRIAEGDTVKIECGAIIYDYLKAMSWRKDGEVINNIARNTTTTQYSRREIITWENITKEDSGVYECGLYNRNNYVIIGRKSLRIKVDDPEPAAIISKFDSKRIEGTIGDEFIFDCTANGTPTATLIWYKNDENFMTTDNDSIRNDVEIIIKDINDVSIKFKSLKLDDSGVYRCHAQNRFGADQKEFELVVRGNYSFFVELSILKKI